MSLFSIFLFGTKRQAEVEVVTVRKEAAKKVSRNGTYVVDAECTNCFEHVAMPKHLLKLMRDLKKSPEWLMQMYQQYLQESIVRFPLMWRGFLFSPSLALASTQSHADPCAHRMVLRNVIVGYLGMHGIRVKHGGEWLSAEPLAA